MHACSLFITTFAPHFEVKKLMGAWLNTREQDEEIGKY